MICGVDTYPSSKIEERTKLAAQHPGLSLAATWLAAQRSKTRMHLHDQILTCLYHAAQLAAWMRVRYPSIIDGAVAASAPVGAFVSRFSDPPFDPAAYWQVRQLTPELQGLHAWVRICMCKVCMLEPQAVHATRKGCRYMVPAFMCPLRIRCRSAWSPSQESTSSVQCTISMAPARSQVKANFRCFPMRLKIES